MSGHSHALSYVRRAAGANIRANRRTFQATLTAKEQD
jgi:hypothetical protein